MVLGSSRFPSSRCWIQRVQEPGSGPRLLRGKDRLLVTRNSVPFDPRDGRYIDSRQPHIDRWAEDLQGAIDRAFKWRRVR